MRLVRILLTALLTVTLLLGGAAALLLGSEAGLRWGLKQLESATGGNLEIGSARGRLLGEIRLEGVRYRSGTSSVSAARLILRWRPESLLEGRLKIVSLEAQRLHVTQQGREERRQPFQGFSLPLPVELEQATVDGFRFSGSGAQPVELDRIELGGSYRDTTLTLRRLTVTAPQGELQARGEIETTAELNFTIDTEWRWNPPPSSIIGAQGALQVTGTPQQYRFRATARLPSEKLSPVQLEMDGSGDLSGLRAEKLHARWLEGEWRGSGRLQWQPALSWNADLSGEGIDPALAWDRWPGGKISLQLTGRGEGGKTEVELKGLKGTVQGYPVAATGSFSFSGGTLRVTRARLASGSARLAASGSVGNKWDAKWRLTAPELAHLWPDLEGRLEASGSVSGPRAQPHLRVRLNGDEVRWRQYLAQRLRSELDFGLRESDPWLIETEIEQIRLGENRLDRISLSGVGTTVAHRLRLQLERDATTRLQSDIRGSLKKGIWRATLENGRLDIPKMRWRQRQGAELLLGASRARLSGWCWEQRGSAICVDGEQRPGAGAQATLSLRRFELGWLREWLPEKRLSVSGMADGEARLSYREGRLDGSRLALRLEPGKVSFTTPDRERHTSGYREIVLQLEKKPQALEATLTADLGKTGSLHGSWRLPGWRISHPRAATQALEGRLQATLKELDLLALFVPRLQQPKGSVTGEMSFAGTLGAPQLDGTVELENGSLSLPDLGLKLREIELQATTRSNRELLLQGSARSGPGRLLLSGELTFPSLRDWGTRLRVQGKELQVANIPEARVIASPDLTLRIRPRRIQIAGRVTIPKAKIKLPEKQGLVPVSPDVVIIGAGQEERRARRWSIATSIALQLGDRVEVYGHGFEGRISGQMAIIESPGRPAIAQGELKIHDGSYKLYGQKFNIEEGRLLYAASPLTNPGLQFRVVRRRQDVEAGIMVFGRLRKPELQLFSTPPMDDSDILAYILIGKPLREATTSEGDRVSQAARSLQLVGGTWLAKRLGKELDIEEVSVESGTGGDGASLVLGKYLSPRLYVQYLIGLTEGGNILRARYEINRNWVLESESGYQSGIDLLFTMER
ncbi:MAG TPA: hypothetical protein ENJ43_07530 [Gammaproteobacteria bacterium]|nr:hypothetical protein [Gammaproteobacteria bacterium]